jgi:glycosyltransferase involved in cell wall biosynthesis
MGTSQSNIAFFVWKQYQRRPEVLAPLIDANLKFFPHLFKSKFLRPLDYCIKLIAGVRYIHQNKPNLIIAQSPPLFGALPALIMGIPYIIDAHNPVFQGIWRKLPLTRYLISNSQLVMVHNSEILQLAKKLYPSTLFLKVSDPISTIESEVIRQANQILVICSFDTWDEPIDLLIEIIEQLSDYTFVITADTTKLPANLHSRLKACSNARLTGFLPTQDYHHILCSSAAALVLTTSDATQPSGACEALSSDTPLIVSKTSLTYELFGEWAILVDNSVQSIVEAIKSKPFKSVDLSSYRDQWNLSSQQEISKLCGAIAEHELGQSAKS